jgi:hypothetical protein
MPVVLQVVLSTYVEGIRDIIEGNRPDVLPQALICNCQALSVILN